jgi:hypothetical protein
MMREGGLFGFDGRREARFPEDCWTAAFLPAVGYSRFFRQQPSATRSRAELPCN